MGDPLLVEDDLEAFLLAWFRVKLAELASAGETAVAGFEVDRVEPASDKWPSRLLVVRDDSGPADLLLHEHSVGLSIVMDNKQNPHTAKRAAAVVMGLVWQVPTDGSGLGLRNPVAAVLETNGPYLVPEEHERARVYGTALLVTTPAPL